MRKGLWGFCAFICGITAFAGINAFFRDFSASPGSAVPNLILGIICIPLTILCIWKYFKPGRRLLPESRKYVPGTPLPVVKNANLILAPGEICHLSENVKVGRLKTVTTGTITSHSGGSVRIAKGISMRSGTSSSRPIRKDVLDTVSGNLYVTNKRIVVSSPKYNFDKPISALSSYTPYSDGFALQFGKETYTILPKEPVYVFSVTLTVALTRQ